MAGKLDGLHRARLVLVHVLDSGRPPRRGKSRKPDSLKRISSICAGLNARGIRTVVRVETGDPAASIISPVLPSDLLPITTHGRRGINRLLSGNVPEPLVHQAACPRPLSTKP